MLATTEIRATAIARGRAIKRVNAWTAVLCGGLPALALGILFSTGLPQWLAGFGVGLLWASLFEYAYHRFLLHLPGTFFARRHLEHHASVGTPTEGEHVNFGSSPIWVVALFAINGIPVVAAELLFGLRIAPGIFPAFAIYFITVEEVHWRIHLEEWLPPVLGASRAYHLSHHARPDARFNIFLPLWDALLGPVGKEFPMVDPYFKLRQEVHVVRNHCASCSELESQMQHPIKVRAIMAYGEGSTYRIEDAKGACFNINEACLCSSASGHESNPCVFCGQSVT